MRPFFECSHSSMQALKCPRRAQEITLRGLQDPGSPQALSGTAVHMIAAENAIACSKKGRTVLHWETFQRVVERGMRKFYDEHREDWPDLDKDASLASEIWQKAWDLHRNVRLPRSVKGAPWRHIPEQRIVAQWAPGEDGHLRVLTSSEVYKLHNRFGRIVHSRLAFDVLSGKPDLLSLTGETEDERTTWTKAYVLDIKSGRAVVQYRDMKYVEQLRWYAFLTFLAYPTVQSVEVVVSGFHLAGNTGSYTYKRETGCGGLTLMEWGARKAADYFKLLGLLFTALPHGEDWPAVIGACQYCPVVQAGKCPKFTADAIELGVLNG